MGRKKTELTPGFVKPGVGMGFVALDTQTGTLVRVRTLANRDAKKNPALNPIAKFSGDAPQFKAQIYKTDTYLVFLCDSGRETVATEDGRYEWVGKSLKEARAEDLAINGDTGRRETVVDSITDNTEAEVEALAETGFVDVADVAEPAGTTPNEDVETEDDEVAVIHADGSVDIVK